MYTFAYQKILFHTLLLLVFKIVESLQCILNLIITKYGSNLGSQSHLTELS